MKYKFERDLEKNLLSMEVIDARRFGRAIQAAIEGLELEARCYCLYEEDYYKDTMAFLEQMLKRLKVPHATPAEDKPEETKRVYMLCPHCGQELKHIKIQTDTETLTLYELMARLKELEEQVQSGRSTTIEEFPEDGLHPETEKVIREYLENKVLK